MSSADVCDTLNMDRKHTAWVVDIGANVGDTAAALIRHTKQNLFCIEPTQKFFRLCKKNILSFGEPYSKRITLLNAYIGQNSSEKNHSFITHGTAVKVQSSDGTMEASTYTLPVALLKQNICLEQVSLIKVDTDGYDAGCIMSLGNDLQNAGPLLYWENQIDKEKNYDDYVELVNYLHTMGYNDFFVFDNFGNYLCHVNCEGLVNINQYLHRIMRHQSARTFYYVDVLACKENHVSSCLDEINKYMQLYIV